MRVQILSDLHLEFNNYKFVLGKYVDVVVLAGDICCVSDKETFENFIESVLLATANTGTHVLFVPGNHEYYRGNWEKVNKYFSSIKLKHFHVLNNRSMCLTDHSGKTVKFIGSTLWSDIPLKNKESVASIINDYNLIMTGSDNRLLTIDDTVEAHKQSVSYIEKELLLGNESTDEPEGKAGESVCVITHHMPSYKCVQPKYRSSPVNSAFTSNLDYLIENHTNKIKLWICGHSHSSVNLNIAKTKIVSNPYGYTSGGVPENKEFMDVCVVEIP